MRKVKKDQKVYIVNKVIWGFNCFDFFMSDGLKGYCPIFTNKKKAEKYAKGIEITEGVLSVELK